MDFIEIVLNKMFPNYLPRDPGSVDEGLLNLVCLAIHVDGKITVSEVAQARAVLKQLHSFKEYDDEELGRKLEQTLIQVQERGFEETAKLACEQVKGEQARRLAYKLVAFMNDADGRVAPIESALEKWVGDLFGLSAEVQRELVAELDGEIGEAKAEKEEADRAEAEPLTAMNCALLDWTGLPRFDEFEPSQIERAVSQLLQELSAEFEVLEREATASWQGVVEPLERLSGRLEFTWGFIFHMTGVMNSPPLREAYQRVQPALVQFSIRLGQSEPLFGVLSELNAQTDGLDQAQRRIVSKLVRDMEQSGIGLKGVERARFNAIQMELAELSTKFSNNLQDATSAWGLDLSEAAQIEGLPHSLLQQAAAAARAAGHQAASAEAGPWRITLDAPLMIPFIKYSAHRELREQVYRAYMTRASSGEHDNTPLLTRILELKQELAGLLGFEHYAALSLSNKMADSVEAVEALLEELRVASFDAAREDLEQLKAFAAEQGAPEAEELRHWDISYWAEKLRAQRYGFNEEELRPYFVFERVLEGLFSLVSQLFGVTIEAADGTTAVWHPDVRYFHVKEQGKLIASFFLDPFTRPGQKRGGAWHSDVTGRSQALAPAGEEVRLPTSSLVCNQAPPVGEVPSLMSYSELRTLFHEFGHGLQHMLTRVPYGMASGISGIEWDAVELPSQFMENWLMEPSVLKRLSSHVDTGEPLSDELIERLRASKTYRAGSDLLRQLYLARVDLRLHAEFKPGLDPLEVQAQVARETSVLPPLEGDRFLCGFAHIFAGGYAAGYFSYKWAEVLSADAFGAFEEAGLDDVEALAETGRRFRETVLALGGGEHPMAVFESFRGRAPSTEALLRHAGLAAAPTATQAEA